MSALRWHTLRNVIIGALLQRQPHRARWNLASDPRYALHAPRRAVGS